MASPAPDLNCVADFFNGWQIYQQVLTQNYMEHRQIAEIVNHYLREECPSLDSVLDLGCGDGVFSRQIFQGLTLGQYWGVDLAHQAITLAQENLQDLAPQINFFPGEISIFIAQCEQQFELILAGFCLHHLSAQQKQEFLREARRCLTPRGRLIWVDVFRQEGESREGYLKRYENIMKNHWTNLSTQVKEQTLDHICQSDYPEMASSFQEWVSNAGFPQPHRLYQGAWETEQVWVLPSAKY
jgi:ubiquinone/menaquinone biosynthesis C-methylase UbiE